MILPILLIIYWVINETVSRDQLTEAYNAYLKGEKATTIAERKEAFNQSLEIYTQLNQSFSPTFGNGKLYFNIANSYFQLEQYPLAIYYYYQAQTLRPRDDKITYNLQIAQQKLGITPDKSKIDEYLSLPERLQLFFGLSFAVLGFASLYIWYPFSLFKRMVILFSLLAALVFTNLIFTKYVTPLEGVLIRGASLHRDAGEQYALVSEEPLLSGTKVDVLNVSNQGQWLKIETPDGNLGFIPKDSIRVID
jgi:tetratricopeptide (TPR) repeat protein